MQCPFCENENTERLSTNHIYRKYIRPMNNPGIIGREEGTYAYPIEKCICFDCGCVFEKMSEENIKKYEEEKQYFV